MYIPVFLKRTVRLNFSLAGYRRSKAMQSPLIKGSKPRASWAKSFVVPGRPDCHGNLKDLNVGTSSKPTKSALSLPGQPRVAISIHVVMIRFCSELAKGVVELWSRGSVKEPPVRISVRPHCPILSCLHEFGFFVLRDRPDPSFCDGN